MLATVGVGITVFVLTNIDDLLLLAAFFADGRLRPGAIVAGQLLGIGALVVASALAALTALVVPSAWIALLGLAPLALGVRLLLVPAAGSSLDDPKDDLGDHRSHIVAVAAVTVANGGDNLGVYIPLFAADLRMIPLHAAVFGVLTLALCAVGRLVVDAPLVGARMRRYAHILLPFVLIGLGLWILRGAAPLVSG